MTALMAAALLGACASHPVPGPEAPGAFVAFQEGKAVYYGSVFQGRATASGEPYDENKLTAAHRTLPFGTIVRVTNLANQRSVVVKINDRGPFGKKDRIIDLSLAAAKALGMVKAGVAAVVLEVEKK
jgi:rare lipoprotein A